MKKFYFALFATLVAFFTFGQTKITVRLDSSLKGSYTGRLYLFTEKDTTKEIRVDEINPQPMYSLEVKNWNNTQTRVIDSTANFFSTGINKLNPGYYKVGAVLDVNTEERAYNFSPGNMFSRKDVILHIQKASPNQATIVINSTVKERIFKETEFMKETKLQSRLMSNFHRKPMFIKAGIVLPPSYYKETAKKYPVVYIIPGWGGTHYDILSGFPGKRYGFGMGEEKIYVYLNPESQTPFGLHAFVDSRVNGPWGKALVEEFIPHIISSFRGVADPNKTFIMGQSTGGYGSAWLILHYPKAFGASFGTAPDPVDFSSFIGIDLYRDVNAYTDGAGSERPFFKLNGEFLSNIRKFTAIEVFLGDGGQQQSFEAEFGLIGKDGKPKLLYDRQTGVIDKKVVEDWKEYDLALYVQRNWSRLKKHLDGKIHLYAGTNDNFKLNESLEAFKKKADEVDANIVVEIIPGVDHFSVWSADFVKSVHAIMDGED